LQTAIIILKAYSNNFDIAAADFPTSQEFSQTGLRHPFVVSNFAPGCLRAALFF
jgi:hypothetical protein